MPHLDFGFGAVAVRRTGRLLRRRGQMLHDVLPGTVIINTSAAIADLEPLHSA